jgi:hypothetical protein
MRRLLLLLPLVALVSCKNVPESVQQAEVFYAKVDSSKFDVVYDMLVDDEKALIGKAGFIALLSDSMRAPGFDTTDEWKVEKTQGTETVLRAIRRAPNWESIDEIRSKRSRKELLKGLAENGNIPLKKDTTRVVTVVTTPAGPRFRIGLGRLIAFAKARDSIKASLASNVTVSLKKGIAENNFQAFFHVTGSVKNASNIDLKPIVFKVMIHGKYSGLSTLKDVVSAKGTYTGEMTSEYLDGLTPQKFGTSFDRGAVNLGGLSAVVVSAAPAERKELDRIALRAIGGEAPVPLF